MILLVTTLPGDGKRYKGNGWTVTLKNGRIICHSTDGRAVCHREFRLTDGIVGLSSNKDVRKRYAHLRPQEFSEFLGGFGITKVKKEDPNRVFYYSYRWNVAENREEISSSLYSDGEVLSEYLPGEEGLEDKVVTLVEGATWAILEIKDDRRHAVILYTLRDAMSLKEELLAHQEFGQKVKQNIKERKIWALSGKIEPKSIKKILGKLQQTPGMKIVSQRETIKNFISKSTNCTLAIEVTQRNGLFQIILKRTTHRDGSFLESLNLAEGRV